MPGSSSLEYFACYGMIGAIYQLVDRLSMSGSDAKGTGNYFLLCLSGAISQEWKLGVTQVLLDLESWTVQMICINITNLLCVIQR